MSIVIVSQSTFLKERRTNLTYGSYTLKYSCDNLNILFYARYVNHTISDMVVIYCFK